MPYPLFPIFVYALAAIGAVALIMNIINSICRRFNPENTGIQMVLLVKNQQETIEGVIRNLMTCEISKKLMSSNKVTVLDMGSTDETLEILKRLYDDSQYFELLDNSQKDEVFHCFETPENTL